MFCMEKCQVSSTLLHITELNILTLFTFWCVLEKHIERHLKNNSYCETLTKWSNIKGNSELATYSGNDQMWGFYMLCSHAC